MATKTALDKLKKAFSVEDRSKYSIYKGEELVLEIFWTPITIADRDAINSTLKAMGKGDDEGSLDFALQIIITKAQDSAGNRLFTDVDRTGLRSTFRCTPRHNDKDAINGGGGRPRCRKKRNYKRIIS